MVTDRVEDTVDYADVCEQVALAAQERSYRTLERLCAAIAERLTERYGAESVRVKAAKPEPPIAAAGRRGLRRGLARALRCEDYGRGPRTEIEHVSRGRPDRSR